jgi:pimeloyl-ACP methyl ester carboxylesterase
MKRKGLLVFIPGLGADERLFYHQKRAFKNILTPSWLSPEKNETLIHYAKRWAAQLKLKEGCVLIGVSFGGMVALEMAQWVKPKVVILVSSCRHPASVPLALRVMGTFSGWPILGKILARLFPYGRVWFLGVKTREQQSLLKRMFFEAPNDFLLWTVSAIRGWTGFNRKMGNIHSIHGDQDHLIPFRNIKSDEVVHGGGHMIILTHPQQVNDFIKKWLN